MKKIYLLIILIISFVGVASAQTTHDKISYQSVVRTGDNHLVYDTWVTVTVSIANGDAPSTVVYSEKHTVLSNANGLISFLIGDGVDQAGAWNAVKWNRAEITLVTSVNGNELSTHTYPLSAVPYALYAKGADAAAYADSVDMDVVQDYLDQHGYLPEEPQVLSISNDTIFLTRGGYVVLPAGFSGNYNDLTNKPDLKPVATSGDYNDLVNKPTKSDLCDSVKDCVTGWISDSTRMVFDTLHNYYATKKELRDTASALRDVITAEVTQLQQNIDTVSSHVRGALIDTAAAIRADMGDAAHDAKITIQKNGVTVGDFTLNQSTPDTIDITVPTTVAELTDAGNYVTNAKLSDTLKAYTTTSQIDTLLGDYATITYVKDTLKAYYDTTLTKKAIHDTANALRGEFPTVNDGQITIAVNRGTVTNPSFTVNQEAGQVVTINIPEEVINNGQLTIITEDDTTRFTANQSGNDTVNLSDFVTTARLNDTLSAYTTTDAIDSIVNKHHFLTSDSALIVRMRDSIQKVNAHVSADSLVLANRIHADSMKLSTRMDTLLKHVCDSVKPCVTDWMNDTLKAYTTTDKIDTIIDKHHFLTSDSMLIVRMRDSIQKVNAHVSADSLVLANRIHADSLKLATRMDTLLKHVCDSVKPCVTDWINDTLKAYTTTNEIDTIVNKHHFLTSDSMLIVRMRDSIQKVNAHVSADSLVLANRIHADSLKLATRMDTLLKHVCDSVKPCVTGWINDTLNAYTTTNEIDSIVNKHHFLTSDSTLIVRMRDSIQKVNAHVSADSLVLATRMDTLLKHVCDSVKPCVTDWMNDTLKAYTTTNKIDTIVDKHHFLTSDSALIVRMRDSIQKVNAHVSADSLVLANRIHADSLKLATRMDTLLKHVCDSVKPCVTGWMNDTLKAYTTTDEIDSIVNKHHFLTSDSTLIVRMRDSIQKVNAHVSADSLVLATRMDTLLKHVCDSVKPCVTDWMNDTLKAYTTTDEIDSIVNKHHFLTSDSALIVRMRDSIQKVNAHVSADSLVLATRMDTLLKHVCDTVKPCVTGWMNDTLKAYTTTNEIDSIVNKHHFLTSDSTLIVRMRDSIQKVNAHVSADSLVLATRMDTLLKHVCDTVKPCVTGWMNDTLKAYTTTNEIDSIVNKHHFLTSDSTLIVRMRDSIQKVNAHVSADSLVLANRIHADSLKLATRMDTLLKHVCDTVKPCVTGWMNDTLSAYYTKTQVDSADSEVRSEIGKGTLTITYGTNPTTTVQFGANQDTNTTVTIPTPPTPTYGTLTITKNNDETVGTFIANVDNTININVPTCDSLANCAFIKDILDRLVKLERQNDSLARELDKMKPSLTLKASQDTVTVCAGSTKPVTYTTIFHNCSSSDYTFAWKVDGVDSSNVTGPTLTFNAPDIEGNYVVICVATRSDSTYVTDTITTKVKVDHEVPSFTATVDHLTVTLSGVTKTAFIQWDTDSALVSYSGTSAENIHTYSVADTVTITATSERGCTLSNKVILQPVNPAVTTDSIPTAKIAATTAIVYGTVTSDGGIPSTKRGVVYDTSNTNLRLGAEGVDSVMSGTGRGSFASNLKQLIPCTQYYVRAFAINDVDTAYGEVKAFNTSSFTCGSKLYDIDGNDYETLLLGSQCWMKQNLRTTHYADGTEIPAGDSTHYDGPRIFTPDSNLLDYGYLYNWAAAMHGSTSSSLNPSGVQGVCPDGWHLPSRAEWTQLFDFVASDPGNVCGDNPIHIIKSLSTTTGWDAHGLCSTCLEAIGDAYTTCCVCNELAANNRTGFSVFPSGTWEIYPHYYTNNTHAIFTSATQHYEQAYNYNVLAEEFQSQNSYVDHTSISKTIGLSVRCVLDTCPLDNTDYKPTVSAVTVTSTGGTTVNMAANVSSDGGATVSERGVCWGTASQPTTDSAHTASGTGIGDFSVNVTTLTPGTTYYVRAYATNSEGTAYGAEVIFEMPGAPTVTTDSIPGGTIAAFKAKVYSTVTSDGGADVTARGICWSTNQNPTIANDTTLNVGGVGSFVASLNGLTPNTTYYVRAYAINSIDTAYGEELSFDTPLLSLDIISDAAATASLCGDPSKTVTYTAEPSSGDISDFSYVWACSGGTISEPSDSSTVAITYTNAATYTVSCTATLKTNASISFSKTTSTTINSGGTRIYLGMCNDSLTINSVEEINNNSLRWANVSSISWGDGSSENLTSANFSHTYTSPGVYTVTITSNIGSCEVKRSFAMGEIVPHPCMVAVAHTNTSKYTLSTGGLETTNSEGKVTAVTDNDTNTYKVVQIGSQCWMAENLRTTKFPNGNEIPIGTSTSSTTAYRYNPIIDAVEPYGYFYNWKAVMNDAPASSLSPSGVRGICPMGWHVPSDDEWTTMELKVNGPFSGTDTSSRGSHAAKLSSRCDWKLNYATYVKSTPGDYSYPERNSSCFGALTTGWFGASNQYSMSTRFWTSSSIGTNIFYREIAYNLAYVKRWLVSSDQGYSLRCVRDEGTAEPLSVTTNAATDIAQTSAILNGSISNPDPDNINITDKGFEWKATDGSYAPAIVDDATLTYNLAGLNPNTGYTFRAFATTPDGTVYGEEQSFITRTDHFTVVTEPVTNISQTSATLHCSIANPDPATISISERGFEWKEATGSTYTKVTVSDATQDYNLTMSYDLAGLTPNKSYSVRAFATIETGTVYGDEVGFATPSYRRILLDTIQHDFVAQYGDTLVNTLAEDHKISITANATVVLRDATISGTNNNSYDWAGITCLDDATIILEGVNMVKGFYKDYPGVYVAPNKTVTIQGTGSLTASSNGDGAGIGGGLGVSCGNIIIKGGTINATAAGGAAGIGSGQNASCGNISVDGGKVTANGGNATTSEGGGGAGIGAGKDASCGNITISGGKVIANGGFYGAGIGAGTGYSSSSTCGDITISSDSLNANGGLYGAGIGAGFGFYSSSECGNISISGGVVNANGGSYGTGIGTGVSMYDNSTCGSITISGGIVVAQGNGTGAAGIGSGYAAYSSYTSSCGDIIINGGKVTANGSNFAAGIGSGYASGSESYCGNIIISGATTDVTAQGGELGSGIGSGAGCNNHTSYCQNITISGGTVKATGGFNTNGSGAGIGSGSNISSGYSSCGDITINYDNVTPISVTAKKGPDNAENSIGRGKVSNNTCGTVTIGGTIYWNDSGYQNGGDSAETGLKQDTYIYTRP